MSPRCLPLASLASTRLRNPMPPDRSGRSASRSRGRLVALLVAGLATGGVACDSKSGGPRPPTGGATGTASGGKAGLGGSAAGGAAGDTTTVTGNAGAGGQSTGGGEAGGAAGVGAAGGGGAG